MTGIELEDVHAALVKGFDPQSFAFFLKTRMEKVLANIAGAGPFNHVVFEVLSVAEQQGWDALLVVRAAEYLPLKPDIQALAKKYGRTLVGQFPGNARNPSVRAAYRELGLAPKGFPAESELGGLEKLIDPANGFVDMPAWLERAAQCQGAICRVEIDNEAMGTGFLVGPSAVLTNHHVLAKVIAEPKLLPKVKLRFDYKRLHDGTILSGTLIPIRKILDHSPATNGELTGNPEKSDPPTSHLDFALVETEGAPGAEPIRVTGVADGKRRGWIRVPDLDAVIDPDPFAPDLPVLIAQHPLGQPLSLAIEWKSMIGPNTAATRVRHRTNTQAGSSGSPCFDRNWHLIALHHYGDAKYGHAPLFNQGIPIAAIRKRVEEQGHAGALGGDIP
jgi:hypothetical protein